MLRDSYSQGAAEAYAKLGVDLAHAGDVITSGYQSAAHYLPQAGSFIARGYQGAANLVHGGASSLIGTMAENPATTAGLHGAGLYAMGADVKGKAKGLAGKVKGLFTKAPPPAPTWGLGSKLALGAAGLGAAGLGYHKWKEMQKEKAQAQAGMRYAPPHYQPLQVPPSDAGPSPYEGY